jgi:hypothetical protein
MWFGVVPVIAQKFFFSFFLSFFFPFSLGDGPFCVEVIIITIIIITKDLYLRKQLKELLPSISQE